MRQWIGDQGYLTYAINNEHTDYLQMAYYLACSIKETQTINGITLATDSATHAQLTDKQREIFDEVVIISPTAQTGKNFRHEASAWSITPYKRTIKVEADMLFTANHDHWWEILDQKFLCFTTDVKTYWGDTITNRYHRTLFDDNCLPNVYTALYYFQYSKESQQFFTLVNAIYRNWDWFKTYYLKNCRYEHPVSDEVFAIAVKIFGEEQCTLPAPLSFVHMKNRLQDIPPGEHWWEFASFEKNEHYKNVGFHRQTLPLHYYDKKFVNVLGQYYDRTV